MPTPNFPPTNSRLCLFDQHRPQRINIDPPWSISFPRLINEKQFVIQRVSFLWNNKCIRPFPKFRTHSLPPNPWIDPELKLLKMTPCNIGQYSLPNRGSRGACSPLGHEEWTHGLCYIPHRNRGTPDISLDPQFPKSFPAHISSRFIDWIASIYALRIERSLKELISKTVYLLPLHLNLAKPIWTCQEYHLAAMNWVPQISIHLTPKFAHKSH